MLEVQLIVFRKGQGIISVCQFHFGVEVNFLLHLWRDVLLPAANLTLPHKWLYFSIEV